MVFVLSGRVALGRSPPVISVRGRRARCEADRCQGWYAVGESATMAWKLLVLSV